MGNKGLHPLPPEAKLTIIIIKQPLFTDAHISEAHSTQTATTTDNGCEIITKMTRSLVSEPQKQGIIITEEL